jgi:hypothetical protein
MEMACGVNPSLAFAVAAGLVILDEECFVDFMACSLLLFVFIVPTHQAFDSLLRCCDIPF